MNLRAYFYVFLFGHFACGAPQKQGDAPLSEVRRLELACENEHPASCFRLGHHFNQHDKVTTRRSKRTFKLGCDLGHGGSCMALADLWLSEKDKLSPSSIEQLQRIVVLYRQACELGEQLGCVKASMHRFTHAQRRVEQFGALGRMKRSCDASGDIGCIEYLRAQLALGKAPSSMVLSRLHFQCRKGRNAANPGDICDRLEYKRCLEESTPNRCAAIEQSKSIIDQASCPADDLEWIVSVVHTSVQECRQQMPSQFELQFGMDGSVKHIDGKEQLGTCFLERLEPISILPIGRVDGCTLKMRF